MLSPKILSEAHKAVDKLLEEDIIEPCDSPWCSPPVLALKPDGTYRFCVNYRLLNSVTKKIVHPIPNIDSILDQLRKARYISKIDMSQAFDQIKIANNVWIIQDFRFKGENNIGIKGSHLDFRTPLPGTRK